MGRSHYPLQKVLERAGEMGPHFTGVHCWQSSEEPASLSGQFSPCWRHRGTPCGTEDGAVASLGRCVQKIPVALFMRFDFKRLLFAKKRAWV